MPSPFPSKSPHHFHQIKESIDRLGLPRSRNQLVAFLFPSSFTTRRLSTTPPVTPLSFLPPIRESQRLLLYSLSKNRKQWRSSYLLLMTGRLAAISCFLTAGPTMTFRFLIFLYCYCIKAPNLHASHNWKVPSKEVQEGSMPNCGAINQLSHDAWKKQ
ncbi:unnamed protein product [Lactuca virosa]|uniref:Uncharacterized protein n=1 Tax=Lactuca virosa TaxID=75947 RepID=A0AAU9NQL3_9ASTR|nr:unnamed protein product [Lactuca virosa]